MKIRPVTLDDIQNVIDLRIQASLEAYGAFDATQLQAWVYKRHGFEMVCDEAFGPYPTLMLVCYSGTKLVARLDWLRSKGVRQVLTEVEETNAPAMCLMAQYGFVEQEVIPFTEHVPAMRWSVQTLTL